jgi:Short-chain dehydrogenases of various substrate specificities
MNKIENKIIVITGATKGVGLALKNALSQNNTVIVMSRSQEEDGKTAFKADVSNREEVKVVFDKIAALYGHIDLLINNAGYGLSGATQHLPENEVRRMVDTNFLGVLWCCQCALPYMHAGSKIANVSSVSAKSPMPFRSIYNSTKAAVTMLSYSLRMETKPIGIDVIAIILGTVATEFANHRTQLQCDDPRYKEALAATDAFVTTKNDVGKMPVNVATRRIIRALAKRHPRVHIVVGTAYKLANVIASLWPGFTMFVTDRVFYSVGEFKIKHFKRKKNEHYDK